MSSSSIRAEIGRVRKTLNTYEDRKKNLEKIKKKLGGDFDNNISAAQRHNSSLTFGLYDGLSGGSLGIRNLCGKIDDAKEKAVWNDKNLSAADDNVGLEINRCRFEISQLEAELSSLQAQLQAVLETEAQERMETPSSLMGS